MRIDDVRKQHEFIEWQYGNGYTEPQEWGAGCSCQEVVYDERMQHACADDCPCRTADPVNLPEAHARHLLGVFVRLRMLRSTDDEPLVPWQENLVGKLLDAKQAGSAIVANVPPQHGVFDAFGKGHKW